MSKTEDPVERAVRSLVRLVRSPLTGKFDDLLIRTLPSEYAESAEHLMSARIEFLKSLNSLIEGRIAQLEKARGKLSAKAKQPPKKERVVVE